MVENNVKCLSYVKNMAENKLSFYKQGKLQDNDQLR